MLKNELLVADGYVLVVDDQSKWPLKRMNKINCNGLQTFGIFLYKLFFLQLS